MTSHTVDVIDAALVDAAWRSSIAFALAWAVSTWWPRLCARDRRNVWSIAIVGVLVTLVATSAIACMRIASATPPDLSVTLVTGEHTSYLNAYSAPSTMVASELVLAATSLVGAMIALARMLAQRLAVRRVLASAHPVADVGALMMIARVAERAGLSRIPAIGTSPAIGTAAVYGVFRPTILFNHDALSWSAERLEQVVWHEMAHIASHDLAISIAARVARAALWWNPLAWLAASRVAREREYACDEFVLAQGIAVADYAETLLDLMNASRNTAPSNALGATGASVDARVTAMLSPTRAVKSQQPRIALALIVLSTIVSGAAPIRATVLQAPRTAVYDLRHMNGGPIAPAVVRIGRDGAGRISITRVVTHGDTMHPISR